MFVARFLVVLSVMDDIIIPRRHFFILVVVVVAVVINGEDAATAVVTDPVLVLEIVAEFFAFQTVRVDVVSHFAYVAAD